MNKEDHMVITNNPLVAKELKDTVNVIYLDVSCRGILKAARDRVYEGHRLLSHPLAGSISPGGTPYRSVMISAKKEATDVNSAAMIENAINFFGGSNEDIRQILPGPVKDLQFIDLELIKSAIGSAGC